MCKQKLNVNFRIVIYLQSESIFFLRSDWSRLIVVNARWKIKYGFVNLGRFYDRNFLRKNVVLLKNRYYDHICEKN
jgi:hypothetical protein